MNKKGTMSACTHTHKNIIQNEKEGNPAICNNIYGP